MLVNPEDRQPRSDESLADRLRGYGVTWSDREVAEALSRMTRLYGADLRAEGMAAGALAALAKRRNRIDRLGAYLARLTDDQLLDLRVTDRPTRKPAEKPPPPGCATCTEDTSTPVGFVGEDSEGRYLPCPNCKPHLVRRPAA